jgi:hypothetical protein
MIKAARVCLLVCLTVALAAYLSTLILDRLVVSRVTPCPCPAPVAVSEDDDILDPAPSAEVGVTITAWLIPCKAKQTYVLAIEARIADGYHIYSITQAPGGPPATVITTDRTDMTVNLCNILPPPKVVYNDVFPGIPIETHSGKVFWFFEVSFPDFTKGPSVISGEVLVYPCGTDRCLLPKLIPYSVEVPDPLGQLTGAYHSRNRTLNFFGRGQG